MVELSEKVNLFIFIAFICQKLFFHNSAGGHFGFTPLEKNAGIFSRDIQYNTDTTSWAVISWYEHTIIV